MGNRTKTRPAPAQNFNQRPKPEKILGEENGSEKIVGLKKIGLDKFLFKRFVGYKKMLGPKNVLR